MDRHDVEAAESLCVERGQVDRDSGALRRNSLGPTHDYRPKNPSTLKLALCSTLEIWGR